MQRQVEAGAEFVRIPASGQVADRPPEESFARRVREYNKRGDTMRSTLRSEVMNGTMRLALLVIVAAGFAYLVIIIWSGDVVAFAGGYSIALLVLVLVMAGEPTVANGLSARAEETTADTDGETSGN